MTSPVDFSKNKIQINYNQVQAPLQKTKPEIKTSTIAEQIFSFRDELVSEPYKRIKTAGVIVVCTLFVYFIIGDIGRVLSFIRGSK